MKTEREKFEEWYAQQVCEIPKTICFSEKEGGYVINNAGLINEMNANILKNILNIGLYAWKAAKADDVQESKPDMIKTVCDLCGQTLYFEAGEKK